MQDSQPNLNNDHNSINQGFKLCYSRLCGQIAKNSLKIVLLNKRGWFCDSCKIELLNLKLVVEE